jgi:hypothetical protein
VVSNVFTDVTVRWLISPHRIREVLVSNLGTRSGYRDWGFPQSLQMVSGIILWLVPINPNDSFHSYVRVLQCVSTTPTQDLSFPWQCTRHSRSLKQVRCGPVLQTQRWTRQVALSCGLEFVAADCHGTLCQKIFRFKFFREICITTIG